jgi:hypothetical protein
MELLAPHATADALLCAVGTSDWARGFSDEKSTGEAWGEVCSSTHSKALDATETVP